MTKTLILELDPELARMLEKKAADLGRSASSYAVWDRLFEAVSRAYDGDLQMVDSSSIRVHQHAGNVKKGAGRHPGHRSGRCSNPVHGALAGRADDENPRARRCLRSADRHQAHRGPSSRRTQRRRHVRHGRGRPGHTLLADRAYDSDALRNSMADRGAWANIKPVSRRLEKPAFSTFLYRERNLVERFFNKLKHYRAIATRYDKHAANYLALVKLAATRIWLRSYQSVT